MGLKDTMNLLDGCPKMEIGHFYLLDLLDDESKIAKVLYHCKSILDEALGDPDLIIYDVEPLAADREITLENSYGFFHSSKDEINQKVLKESVEVPVTDLPLYISWPTITPRLSELLKIAQ